VGKERLRVSHSDIIRLETFRYNIAYNSGFLTLSTTLSILSPMDDLKMVAFLALRFASINFRSAIFPSIGTCTKSGFGMAGK
jgi:hypothetical protein